MLWDWGGAQAENLGGNSDALHVTGDLVTSACTSACILMCFFVCQLLLNFSNIKKKSKNIRKPNVRNKRETSRDMEESAGRLITCNRSFKRKEDIRKGERQWDRISLS